MKTALITTTINVPTVLELYRQHGPDVAFFVAGDEKTPNGEIHNFFNDRLATGFESQKQAVGAHYLSPIRQRGFDYKCSDLIGWNSIQRRNIALLEAVKWGADIIVSVDDDNIPLEMPMMYNYFDFFEHALCGPFRGIKVSSPTGWFDVGQLLDPIAPHRGFPISVDGSKYEVSHVTGSKVGVAAGMCLGDPDCSAVTRICQGPIVHRVSELLQSGIVVDLSTRTVFNSQNTAFIRELAPAFFMLPGVGRYDDIYASLIMQRVMRERNLHVHFGKPFVWQQRNQHNMVKDLRGEIEGMENIVDLAERLNRFLLLSSTVVTQTREIYRHLADWLLIPSQTLEAALAFLDDMELIL